MDCNAAEDWDKGSVGLAMGKKHGDGLWKTGAVGKYVKRGMGGLS